MNLDSGRVEDSPDRRLVRLRADAPRFLRLCWRHGWQKGQETGEVEDRWRERRPTAPDRQDTRLKEEPGRDTWLGEEPYPSERSV